MITSKKIKVLTLAAAVLAAVSLAGCGSESSSVQNKGNKNVTIAMTSAWASANPYGSNGNYTALVQDQIYDRLWIDKFDGSVLPRLAESYEVAADHASMTVHLNPKAKFTDGKPVTADDVVFSAQLVTNPKFNAAHRSDFKYVQGTSAGGVAQDPSALGFTKIDDHTIKITFKNPMNELPILTNMNRYFFIVPQHIYGSKTIEELNNADVWKQNWIGSGPFKYVSQVDGERVEYERNDDYFLGKPDIEKLTIRVMPATNLLAGLQSGEVDILAGGGIGGLPIPDYEAASDDKNLKVESVPNYGYQAMIFNTQSPRVINPKVRLGISTAIDRKAIVDNLLKGHGEVIYAPYSDKHPFVDESKLTLPVYNPEKAKQLLEEGGFDFNQPLDLIVPTGNEVRIQSTVLIQQDLEKIGVKTNITQYDFSTLMDKMRKGEFDLGMCGAAGTLDPSNPTWMIAGVKNNFTNVPDDRYSKLYAEAAKEVDLDKEKAAFNNVWQFIIDDAPIAYLYSNDSLVAYNKNRLDNIDPSLFEQVNWNTASWKVK